MDNIGADIFKTHMSPNFKKRLLRNSVLSFLLLCATLYNIITNEDLKILNSAVFMIFTVIFIIQVSILTVRHPLRITSQGVIMRYAPLMVTLFSWNNIVGLGIHPKRNAPCLLWRDTKSGETKPVPIAWSMIREDQQDVMDILRKQLSLRGRELVGNESGKV